MHNAVYKMKYPRVLNDKGDFNISQYSPTNSYPKLFVYREEATLSKILRFREKYSIIYLFL